MKLRAWNRYEGEWEDGSVADVYVGMNGEAMVYDGSNVWGEIDCLEFHQFTGATDIKGNEIFQEDIVVTHSISNPMVGVVRQRAFSWVVEPIDNGLTIPLSDMIIDDNSVFVSVIGNTCEKTFSQKRTTA